MWVGEPDYISLRPVIIVLSNTLANERVILTFYQFQSAVRLIFTCSKTPLSPNTDDQQTNRNNTHTWCYWYHCYHYEIVKLLTNEQEQHLHLVGGQGVL